MYDLTSTEMLTLFSLRQDMLVEDNKPHRVDLKKIGILTNSFSNYCLELGIGQETANKICNYVFTNYHSIMLDAIDNEDYLGPNVDKQVRNYVRREAETEPLHVNLSKREAVEGGAKVNDLITHLKEVSANAG